MFGLVLPLKDSLIITCCRPTSNQRYWWLGLERAFTTDCRVQVNLFISDLTSVHDVGAWKFTKWFNRCLGFSETVFSEVKSRHTFKKLELVFPGLWENWLNQKKLMTHLKWRGNKKMQTKGVNFNKRFTLCLTAFLNLIAKVLVKN